MRRFRPDLVKSRRKRMGKTQTRLSREVGISQASLCNIEKGRKDPRAGTLARIAEALDCGLDTFFVCD